MQKLSIIFLCVLGALLVAVLVSGLLMLRGGLSARDDPSAIESFVAPRMRRLAIPEGATTAKNPVPASPEVLAEAMAHFADHCTFCHANDGSGMTPIGQGLYPKPPDMRLDATQNLKDGEIFYIIHNGIRLTGMPAFGDASKGLNDVESWKLVHFIRRLPHLTPEEIEPMRKMNPKSPAELEEEAALERFLRGEDSEVPEPQQKHH